MIQGQQAQNSAKKVHLILMCCTFLPGLLFCMSSGTEAYASRRLDYTHLEDEADQWGIYQDGGQVSGALTNIASPSTDGRALQVSLEDGEAYAGLHAYRNLGGTNASTFELNLSFYFTEKPAIQALEFTMNTWRDGQRWEWAMQWEQVGDGSAEQGSPPTWRIWTGTSWADTGIRQDLAPNTWHELSLAGENDSGLVHYSSFRCDGTNRQLTQRYNPVSSEGEKVAIAVQLNGNSQEAPYQLVIDNVNLRSR